MMLRRRVEARIVLQQCMLFGMNCYEARCFGLGIPIEFMALYAGQFHSRLSNMFSVQV